MTELISSVGRFVAYAIALLLLSIVLNVLRQQLPRNKAEPPVVFHWLPFVGSAVSYGTDPFNFYVRCQKKHGDVFTFILLGKKMTVYLGIEGNDFILNGKLQDLNAEEIYSPLTTPVFGSDIIYDCPNAKLMEQKKFVKFGLTQRALESYVPLIEKEVLDYMKSAPSLQGPSGTINIPAVMAEITILTASRTLQGPEVRKKLTGEFAELYNDLDLGFRPINFLMPWAPLPQNRRRDVAHVKMRNIYMDLIKERRAADANLKEEEEEPDMIRNLMGCTYKDGTPLPDKEIAHMMITLLMAGQHSSSSASAWVMLRLASRPDIAEALYREQASNLGPGWRDRPLTHADLDRLPLARAVVRETLRVHSSIHSIMRKVVRPLTVPSPDGGEYVVPPGHALVASPIVTHFSEAHFADALKWDPYRWMDAGAGAGAANGGGDKGVVEDDEVVDYGYGATSRGTRSPYLPFGAGRHRCIGESFAYVNLVTIVATLVRHLRFGALDGSGGPAAVPPTDYASLFSRPHQPAVVRWDRRAPES